MEQRSVILEDDLASERKQHQTSCPAAEAASAKALALEENLKGSEAKAEELRLDLAKLIESHDRVHGKYKSLRKAFEDAIDKILKEMLAFMSYYGLTAPKIPHQDLDVAAFFDWLRTCLAMLDAGGKLYGDLSVVFAARTLVISLCSLLPIEGIRPPSILKTQLRLLRDEKYEWTSGDAVKPDVLLPLPKNIAKNFMNTFFNVRCSSLVWSEGLLLQSQVSFSSFLIGVVC